MIWTCPGLASWRTRGFLRVTFPADLATLSDELWYIAVMDRPDAMPPPVQHTCTFEERCKRWQAAQAALTQAQTVSRALRHPVTAQITTADLRRRLDELPSGQRIGTLRRVLRWTQSRAAAELGVSRRTIIRHEQGRHPWIRWSLLCRLRELEFAYEQQLLAHLWRVPR